MDSDQITYFAETDSRNKRIRFGVKQKDRLRHVYVIGKTGVGKSTLLENMAIQDIQNGNGCCFIDPHGSTAEKLLEYVPENRIKDVLYFAPFDLEHPISFNVLEDIGPDKRHLVVNGLMSTFEKIWVDAWSARMAYILNNTLLALLEYPGATLLGVNRMLSDKEYRKKVVDNIKDPTVKTFWVEEFGKYTERYAAEATPSIQNKVGQFTSNPLVRNLIGQPKSSFDIRDFMDNKKILLINLSKGLVGEGNAKLIGSMLITKIYLAAMSRADKNKEELSKLPPFYLYVDEFQSFANKSFADILSEARKYKLSLNITHQYIEQMEEEVRNAVFGNVGTMISFRVGAFDAEVLEREFAPVFTAEDLVNLGKYQFYIKLMIDDVSSAPFSAISMPPIEKPEIIFKNDVVEMSRKQYTRPRAEVEKEIQDWHEEGVKKVEPKPNVSTENTNHKTSTQNGETLKKPEAPQEKKENTPNNDRAKLNRHGLPMIEEERHPAEISKVDQNKLAFMKASEELKSIQTVKKEEKKEEKFATLNTLKEDKKTPSVQNLSSLKEALSSVISKSKQDVKEEVTPPKKQEVSEFKIEEKPKVFEAKSEEKPKTENRSEPGKRLENSGGANSREVPEDVLREILSMDDSGGKDK